MPWFNLKNLSQRPAWWCVCQSGAFRADKKRERLCPRPYLVNYAQGRVGSEERGIYVWQWHLLAVRNAAIYDLIWPAASFVFVAWPSPMNRGPKPRAYGPAYIRLSHFITARRARQRDNWLSLLANSPLCWLETMQLANAASIQPVSCIYGQERPFEPSPNYG